MEKILLVALFVAAAVFYLRRSIPGALLARGNAHQERGELEAAERSFLQVLAFENAIRRLTGARYDVALASSRLGFLYHRQRRIEDAERMFTAALGIHTALGRAIDAARIRAALGKLHFDNGDLARAAQELNEALAVYARRADAPEAIATIHALLQSISERLDGATAEHTYTHPQYGFSFTIPAGWVAQRLDPRFATADGQVSVSHKTHTANLNVSVGPTDLQDVRLRGDALRDHVAALPERIGEFEVKTGTVGGEPNTVGAEYTARLVIQGVPVIRRSGLTSVVHGGLEYCVQWSAMTDREDDVQVILSSFRFAE